jgi:hypothetical protein
VRRYRYRGSRRFSPRTTRMYQGLARLRINRQVRKRARSAFPHHHSIAYLAYVVRESSAETSVMPALPAFLGWEAS